MGALTLKSFPFELRGWDLQKYENIDYTDSFGSNVRLYVLKNQIIQIEPDFNENSTNEWISDKGRSFFDSMTGEIGFKAHNKKSLKTTLRKLMNCMYITETCRLTQNRNKLITFVFENINLETINVLTTLNVSSNFIEIKKSENINLNNDLEKNFTIDSNDPKFLFSSTVGVLVNTNTRYEGFHLNLKLKQRFLKGNFELFIIGSLVNLTFPAIYAGSNLKSLKGIIEGNSAICQSLKPKKKPAFIYNLETLKRNDLSETKFLNYTSILNKNYNSLNFLSSNLSEVGGHLTSKFQGLNKKDFEHNNNLCFLNVSSNNIVKLKNIINLKFLNYNIKKKLNLITKSLTLNCSFDNETTKLDYQKMLSKTGISNEYSYLPSKSFFSTNNTFITSEGINKKSIKVISENNKINSMHLIKKLNNYIKQKPFLLKQKRLLLQDKKELDFYVKFQYLATAGLSNFNFYIFNQIKPFNLKKRFKNNRFKLHSTKFKYWVDDFFDSSKDEYTLNSKILMDCSNNIKLKNTNFF